MAGRNKNLEKCFEDSQESGVFNISHRNMRELPGNIIDYDLTDVVRADISNNKFSEVPAELHDAFMMESLNCAYNNIRYFLDLSHITSLTYINLSHNQIQALPVHICSLPLKTLILNHNRLQFIPGEIGLLGKLQLLDVSCNEIANIPNTFGELASLRILDLRRNQLLSLPDEISKLKQLMTLDISCNRISIIPPAFRLLTSLIKLDLSNNPLTSPPAQVCLKGRLHVFKYLSLTAQHQQDKSWSLDREPKRIARQSPSSSSISSSGQLESDLKLNNIDESRESHEDFDMADHKLQSIVHMEASGSLDAEDPDSSMEEIHYRQVEKAQQLEKRIQHDHKVLQQKIKENPHQQIPKSKPATLSRSMDKKTPLVGHNTMSLDRASTRKYGNTMKSYNNESNIQTERKENLDVMERKEQLLKMRKEALITKQKLDKIRSEPENAPIDSNQGTSVPDQPLFEGIGKRSSLSKMKTAKALKEGHSSFTMRRIFDSAKEEFNQLEKLRVAIESRLHITLPDDLPAALSDGVVLCHLINHLRKSTIPVIHVPSAGMPKLTMPKCLMNVDAFLEGCRKLGVEKAQLCSPADILEEKSPNKVCTTVHALLQATSFTSTQETLANICE